MSAFRSTWKGFLKISLVSVPVKAFAASVSTEEIHLNQLCTDCHSRIQYKKKCPVHGDVQQGGIVSGYEYDKDKYVIVHGDELDKMRTPNEKALSIDNFVAPDALDPAYLNGKTYYLAPDGPAGHKPFALLRQGLIGKGKWGLAKVVLNGKDQLMLIRPIGKNLLAMSSLNYHTQVKQLEAFEAEAPATEVSTPELDLIGQLIDSATKDFDFASYKDEYQGKLAKLIEAKVAGQELVAPPAETEDRHVINLMEALQASVMQAAAAKGQQAKEAQQPDAPARPKRTRRAKVA